MDSDQKMLLNPFNCLRAAWTFADTFHREVTCRVCLTSTEYTGVGLFPISSGTKRLLLEIFTVNIEGDGDWKICISCLKSIGKAAKFREMVKISDSRYKFMSQRDNMISVSSLEVVGQKEVTDQNAIPGCNQNLPEQESQENVHSNQSINEGPKTFELRTIPCTASGCKLKFSKEKFLLIHQRKTHGMNSPKKLIPCTEPGCTQTFCELNLLEIHQKSHSSKSNEKDSRGLVKTIKPRIIPCTEPKCGLKFSEPKYLLAHQRRTHGMRKAPRCRQCEICREKFHTEEELIQHRSSHKRSSYTNNAAQRGSTMLKKAEVPPFKCPHCPNTYRYAWNVIRHVKKSHQKKTINVTSKTSFGKQAIRKTTFINQPKKFVHCGICYKKMADMKTLMHHRATIHPGDKMDSTSCNICGKKGFQHRRAASSHKKRMHPEFFK